MRENPIFHFKGLQVQQIYDDRFLPKLSTIKFENCKQHKF